MGYSQWGHKESDVTGATKHSTVKQKDSICMNNSTGGQERDRSLLT